MSDEPLDISVFRKWRAISEELRQSGFYLIHLEPGEIAVIRNHGDVNSTRNGRVVAARPSEKECSN